MGQLLSHPLTDKTIIYNDYRTLAKHNDVSQVDSKYKPPRYFNCVGSMQGYRLTQEDAHLILNESDRTSNVHVNFYNPFLDEIEVYDLSIFAVFDGHGTDECSKFISGQSQQVVNALPKNKDAKKTRGHIKAEPEIKYGLSKWIVHSFQSHKYGAMNVNDSSGRHIKRKFETLQGLISQIIKDSFIMQDQELYKKFSRTSCGSTAVVAIIINDEYLYVANCGDSRCILSSRGDGIKTMSFDHKPQHIGELLRINDNGGTVSLGRVGGVLALSRAFSDFQFKRNVDYNRASNLSGTTYSGIPPQEAQVTVEPDVLMHKISYSKDEFIVLACDGIWDVYSNKQVTRFIKHHLLLGLKLDVIMTKLLDQGIAQANSDTGVGFDNMTAVIVILNKPGESLSDWYAKMKSRLERERGHY